MAIKSAQVTLGNVTAIPIITSDIFTQTTGANGDELPALVANVDPAITVYLGGLGVTSATGTPLAPGQSLSFRFMGAEATTLYAVGASGTPKVAVLLGRQ